MKSRLRGRAESDGERPVEENTDILKKREGSAKHRVAYSCPHKKRKNIETR